MFLVYAVSLNLVQVRTLAWIDPIRNPYAPGAGSRPPALTGRDEEIEAFRVLLARLRLARPEKSMLITGLCGVGKTVLLNTFEAIAEEAGFRTAKSEITHEHGVSRADGAARPASAFGHWSRQAHARARAACRRGLQGVHAAHSGGVRARRRGRSAHRPRRLTGPWQDLSDLFVALGEAAAEHDAGVVFLLDEVQFLASGELEALIAALHQVSQRELAITLAGAGLPQLPALSGAAKSYSERLFRSPAIDRLDGDAARDALELPAKAEGVSYKRRATDEILKLTEGYPYFLQEYGKHVWNVAAGPTITLADVRRCTTSFNSSSMRASSRFASAARRRPSSPTSPQRRTSAKVPTDPGRSPLGSAGRGPRAPHPRRGRLIEKGLIYSPSYGMTEFAVPHFQAFIRRRFPLLD